MYIHTYSKEGSCVFVTGRGAHCLGLMNYSCLSQSFGSRVRMTGFGSDPREKPDPGPS